MIARRRLVAALLVPFGVVVSHLIAYLAARPQGSARADAVADAHGHLAPLLLVAVVGVGAAVMVAGSAGSRGLRLRLTPAALAGWQAGVFAAMETAEHMTHGSGLADAVTEPSMWIGLSLQLVVALVSCALLRVGEAVGRRLALNCRRSWRRTPAVRRFALAADAVPPVRVTSLSRRGPPQRAVVSA